jgi:hypothetical protein
MNRTNVLIIVMSVVLASICGCGGPKTPDTTGFLSDYSNLKLVSDDSFRFADKAAFSKCNAFIVDPVTVHFKEGSEAIKEKSEGKVTEKDLMDLTNYFHDALVKAITEAGYTVAYQSGPGVARIRVAITDLKETGALNMLPQASLLGVGVGGMAMEAEIVDSVTGKQIGAVIETQKGGRVPFTNLGEWGTAKGIMDGWAKRLKERLDEGKSK